MLGVTAWRGILRICIGVARIVYHGAGYAGGGSSPPVRIWLAATVKGCSAVPRLRTISRGRAVWQARRVHTPKVAGSNPAFAICRERIINQLDGGNAVQRAPVVRWVLFVMPIFIRRTRHQQATPPRGNTRLSPMVPVGSYLESEVSPND